MSRSSGVPTTRDLRLFSKVQVNNVVTYDVIQSWNKTSLHIEDV